MPSKLFPRANLDLVHLVRTVHRVKRVSLQISNFLLDLEYFLIGEFSMKWLLLFILPMAAMLFGCSGVKLKAEKVLEPHPPKIGKEGQCLAFSGGGIRSGAVSLGALQGFSESLSQFEYLSTVSGGGYPVYGVVTESLDSERSPFEVLKDESFIQAIEANSDFIGILESDLEKLFAPVSAAISLPLSWMTGNAYGAFRPTYKAKINNTFAPNTNILFKEYNLSKANKVEQYGFPKIIFGASASVGSRSNPDIGYTYSYDEFFELSATVSGSPRIGYTDEVNNWRISLADAVAMSAAAIDSPQSTGSNDELRDFLKDLNVGVGGSYTLTQSDKQTAFYLGDGGFIENLAIIPLLRRGCSSILVFDNSEASHNPMAAWEKFSSNLPKEMPGWSIEQDLAAQEAQLRPETISDAWNLSNHFWDATLKNGASNVRLRLVKLGVDQNRAHQYPEEVRLFMKRTWPEAGPGCNGKEGFDKKCSFPLSPTVDQSFTPEEFRAYRLLGFWLAQEAIR